jgi:hypothetical protein
MSLSGVSAATGIEASIVPPAEVRTKISIASPSIQG